MVEPGGDILTVRLERDDDLPPLDYATVVLLTAVEGLEPSGLPLTTATNEVSCAGDNAGQVRFLDPNASGDDEGEREFPDWLNRTIQLWVSLHDANEEDAEGRFLVYALRRSDSALQTGDGDLTWLGVSTQTTDEHCSLVGDAARRVGEARVAVVRRRSRRWSPAHEVDKGTFPPTSARRLSPRVRLA